MQQHPAIWRRAVSAMEPGAIAGTTHSTGRLLQRGRPRSCQRGSNGLADRVTSAEYVRERPSREPCGALAYSSDEQYSSSATRTLSVHRRCGIAAREGPMTRLRASIPLRDRRGLVDDSVGWCLVRVAATVVGKHLAGQPFPQRLQQPDGGCRRRGDSEVTGDGGVRDDRDGRPPISAPPLKGCSGRPALDPLPGACLHASLSWSVRDASRSDAMSLCCGTLSSLDLSRNHSHISRETKPVGFFRARPTLGVWKCHHTNPAPRINMRSTPAGRTYRADTGSR
jgi:hypothetical protein